jgi:DNA-binding transcriptional regulator YdaS (Cro superfamily)
MTSQEETRKMFAYVAARMGGVEQLASRLGIHETTASHYVTGKENIPNTVVLRVVDLVLEGIPEKQTAKNLNPSTHLARLP